MAPKTQALRGEAQQQDRNLQKHIELVAPFVEVVRKAEQVVQRHEQQQQQVTTSKGTTTTKSKTIGRSVRIEQHNLDITLLRMLSWLSWKCLLLPHH